MKRILGWIFGILGILILFLLFTIPFWGSWIWRDGWQGWTNWCCGGYSSGWRMHGPGMMWGFMPFGWPGMLFMTLIPLGFLALTVLGIVWLVRVVSGIALSPANSRTCPNCSKNVQAHWKHCPYCGTSLP